MGDRHRKLMCLAIDASPADRMTAWMDDGSLPTLASLRQRGSHGRIESTAEFMVGTPWPSFYTGTYPPEHGWMFYLAWRPDLMRFVRATPEWQPVEPFYRNFPLDGPRVIAVDVPITYAPKPFNGVELTGWGTHDKIGAPAAYPVGLVDRVRRKFGDMPIPDEFTGRQTANELLALRDSLVKAADWHSRIGRTLMQENAWDFFFLGFGSVHRAGHRIWNRHGAVGHPSDRQAEALDEAMRQVAMATDKAVGDLIEAAGEGTNVIVFSLHGMTENFSVYPLFDRMLERILGGEKRDDPETPPRSPVSAARDAIPLGLRARIKARLPFALQDRMTLFWHDHSRDRSRAKAFMLAGDLEGMIRVNLKGRERDGIVEPGREYDLLLDEIERGLRTFVDIDSGDPLVRDVHRGRDLWPEAVQRRPLPDLLVRNPIRSGRTVRGFVSEEFGIVRNYDHGNYVDGRSGHHIGEGWFVAMGPDLPGRGGLGQIHEFDLLASIHALLGEDMRPEMRGSPIAGLHSSPVASVG